VHFKQDDLTLCAEIAYEMMTMDDLKRLVQASSSPQKQLHTFSEEVVRLPPNELQAA